MLASHATNMGAGGVGGGAGVAVGRGFGLFFGCFAARARGVGFGVAVGVEVVAALAAAPRGALDSPFRAAPIAAPRTRSPTAIRPDITLFITTHPLRRLE